MNQLSIIISIIYLYISGLSFAVWDSPQVTYEVNVINYQDDLFHVTIYTGGLKEENNIYNLPATVPGTYSLLNFGRFVTTFTAFDEDENQLEVERISTNRWQISNIENLAKIKYDMLIIACGYRRDQLIPVTVQQANINIAAVKAMKTVDGDAHDTFGKVNTIKITSVLGRDDAQAIDS